MKDKTREGVRETLGCLAAYGILVLICIAIAVAIYFLGGLPPK